ncbi:addiction module protein [bacterium]|nr:addiction module protein [bacterium]
MSEHLEHIFAKALELPPVERAELVERILSSLEFPARKTIDASWAREAEERINTFEKGELPSIPVNDVFKKIDKL